MKMIKKKKKGPHHITICMQHRNHIFTCIKSPDIKAN